MDPRVTRRVFFVILVVLSIGLLGAIVSPMAGALFVASVLAGALYPLQRRLTKRFGGRMRLAAGLVTLGVLVALVLPLSVIGTVVVTEIVDGVQFVRQTVAQSGVEGLIRELPGPLRGPAERLIDWIPVEDIELAQVSEQGGRAAALFGTVLAATSGFALQTVLMLIMLFFLLVDGKTLVRWLSEIVPLPSGQFGDLLLEFRKVSRSVLVSSLATAAVQTLAALIGFFIAGVPKPIFFAFVTFFFALIPAIGAGGLTLALSLLLLLMGRPIAAGFLAVWAMAVVGLADNVVKPLLIRSELHLHGAVVFFSLLGGLAVFGPIGLIAGPLAVTFFLSLLRIHRRAAEQQEATPENTTLDPDVVTQQSTPADTTARIEGPRRTMTASTSDTFAMSPDSAVMVGCATT